MQPKFTTDFYSPFKKVLTPFPVFINRSEPSKLRTIVGDEHRAGRPRLDRINSTILSLFQERESQSVQSLAQELDVSLSTVHARLTDVLGFTSRHMRWVPHLLTDELKAKRVATSMRMLEILD
jgi:hypothetical protein